MDIFHSLDIPRPPRIFQRVRHGIELIRYGFFHAIVPERDLKHIFLQTWGVVVFHAPNLPLFNVAVFQFGRVNGRRKVAHTVCVQCALNGSVA